MRFILFSSFLFACRSDEGVKVYNSQPQVTITSHADGSEIQEGYNVTFVGLVSDANHTAEELSVTWSSNNAVLCSSSTPSENGESMCEAILSEDDGEIRLQAIDPEDGAGVVSISVDVIPSSPPSAQIISPQPENKYYSDQKITFEARIEDEEDEPDALSSFWESDLDGTLGDVDTTPNSSGDIIGFGYLAEGEHAIKLQVEDTTGKTDTTSVIIQVGPPNSAPLCEILSPQSGESGAENTAVDFSATVSDADIAADQLSIEWSSDKDGVLGSSTASSGGDVIFSYSDLSVNTHAITMTVLDELGTSCTALISYTVGTPPTITLDSPIGGTVYSQGDTIQFSATVSDEQDQPSDIDLSWDINGATVSTQSATSSGTSQWSDASLEPGDYTLVVTATDGDGLTDSIQTTFAVNGLPSQPEIHISPNPATTTDELTAIIDVASIDPEGAAISYTYEWFVNNVSQPSYTGSTVPFSATSKGDIWKVQVTPYDDLSAGNSATAEVEISNTLPVITSVSISPSAPTAQTSTFECHVVASDEDGESPTVTFNWYVDNSILSTETQSTLSGSYSYGQVVQCEATPSDSQGSGVSQSASVTIENSAPDVDSVTFDQVNYYTTDEIVANVSLSDVDSSQSAALHASFEWHILDSSDGNTDKIVQTGSSNTLDGSAYFDRDDEVYVVVVPNDGIDNGPQYTSTSTTIENTPPTSASISISPDPAVEGEDDLICAIDTSATDLDGDTVYYNYTWSDPDGVTQQSIVESAATSDVFIATGTTTGTWTCTVTPTDLTSTGDSTSANLFIEPACTIGEEDCPGLSCDDILGNGGSIGDGIYWIDPLATQPFAVYCDMTEFDGGWTLLAKFSATGSEWQYQNANWTNGTALQSNSALDPNADEDAKSSAWMELTVDEVRLQELGTNASSGAYVIFEPNATTLENLFLTAGQSFVPTDGDIRDFSIADSAFQGTSSTPDNIVSINYNPTHSSSYSCCELSNRVRIGSLGYTAFSSLPHGAANTSYVGVGGSTIFRDGHESSCCNYATQSEVFSNTSGDSIILWGR